MNEEAKKIAKKINALNICLRVASFVVIYLIYMLSASFTYDWFESQIPAIIITLAAIFVILRLNRKIVSTVYMKNVAPVLSDEADANKYREILTGIKMAKNSLDLADAAYYAGDYQSAVNTFETYAKAEDSPSNVKIYCLTSLMNIYFELRDFEKMREASDKFEELRQLHPSNPYFQNYTGFYRLFSDRDYEACKGICREWERSIPAEQTNNLYKSMVCFWYAVTCYESGEKEEARATFELVLTNTPKLYWAELAKKYIEAIDRGIEVVISDHPIVPEENVQLSSVKVPTKKKRIVSAIIAVALICLWILAIYFLSRPPELTDDIVEVLSTRPAYDNGISLKLEGDIYLSIYFVDDNESSWTSYEIEQYMKHQIRPGLDFLEVQAKEYGKSLTIHTKGYSTVPSKYSQQLDLIYDGTVESGDSHTSKYAMLSYFDAAGIFRVDADAPLGCAAILTVVDKEGVSYAYQETSDEKNFSIELAIVFTNYPGQHIDFDDNTAMAATVAHEILHIFGAKDLYEPELLAEYAAYKYPRDIMLYEHNIKLAKIDKYTAYCVGWLDEAPEI